MPQTDIYKNRETTQPAADAPHSRKGRRRRSSSRRAFEEVDRRRRSKNTGFRRLLHLSRKSENEKHIWWGLLIAVVVILTVIGVWQFWYLEHAAREQSKENDLYIPVYGERQTESATE